MKVKIAALVICYNEEASLNEILHSMVGWADDIIIVEGAFGNLVEKGYSKRSTDKTLEIIDKFYKESLPDFNDNVVVKHSNGYDSTDQYNTGLEIARERENDWLWIVDADEFYPIDMRQMVRSTIEKTMGDVLQYRVHSYNFINGFDKFFHGIYPRIFRITPECKFKIENRMVWPDKGKTEDQGQPVPWIREINPMWKFFHMTWNRKPEKIKEKYSFMWASCQDSPDPNLKSQYYTDDEGNYHIPNDLKVYDFRGKLPKKIEKIKHRFK